MALEILPTSSACFNIGSLVIKASSEKQAYQILQTQGFELGLEAYRLRLESVLIYFPNCSNPIKINVESILKDLEYMTNNLIITEPSYVTSNIEVSPVLYRAAGYFLENPEIRGAVVRLSDEKQIILSRANSSLIASSTLLQAVERKRHEYWHPEDLEQFRMFTQELEPNNPDSRREFSFRIFDPVSGDNWRRNTNEYRLIEDALGIKYHFSINLGQEPIPTPRLSA